MLLCKQDAIHESFQHLLIRTVKSEVDSRWCWASFCRSKNMVQNTGSTASVLWILATVFILYTTCADPKLAVRFGKALQNCKIGWTWSRWFSKKNWADHTAIVTCEPCINTKSWFSAFTFLPFQGDQTLIRWAKPVFFRQNDHRREEVDEALDFKLRQSLRCHLDHVLWMGMIPLLAEFASFHQS